MARSDPRIHTINWQHLLSRGLAFAYIPNTPGPPRDLVTGNFGFYTAAGAGPVVGSGGRGTSVTRTGNAYVVFTSYSPKMRRDAPHSTFIVADYTDAGHSEDAIVAFSSGANDGWTLQNESWPDKNIVGYTKGGVVGVESALATPFGLSSIAAVVSAIDVRIFVDGEFETIADTASAIGTPSRVIVGNNTDQIAAPEAIVFCVYIWDRLLSDNEILMLYADPYQLLNTESRVVFPAVPIRKKFGVIGGSQARPSYKQGYARNAAESANPGLWKGLKNAYIPAFGQTGQRLIDVVGGKHGDLQNMEATDWVISGNRRAPGYALDFGGTNEYMAGQVLDTSGAVSIIFSNFVSTAVQSSAFGGFGTADPADRCQAHCPWEDGNVYFDYGNWDGEGGRVSADYSSHINRWTNVALLSSGEVGGSGFMAIYFDGVEAAIGGDSDRPEGDVTIDIGAASALGTYHTGQIGYFYFYNRVLNPSEIWQLHVDPFAPFRQQEIPFAIPPYRAQAVVLPTWGTGH